MAHTTPCPSCRGTMEAHTFASVKGDGVTLDMCFACHGIWIEPQENLQLTAASVVALFRLVHAHRGAVRQPLARQLDCPHCRRTLAPGFDVVRTGRYVTYRCPSRGGRFSTFSSFMVEKGFVRLLTQAEIDTIAQRVAVLHCDGCGAPVDLRKDHACPHCRSAFSLLDPQAVERALQGYAKAASDTQGIKVAQLAEALAMLERDRLDAQRAQRERGGTLLGREVPDLDLWALGVTLVGKMLP